MSEDYQQIKGKKRKLSRFLAEEMLYDFATENLDEHRKASMQEFLDSSEEVTAELEALKRGMVYCQELAETEISPDLNYKLSRVRSLTSQFLRVVHWSNWPEVTKWTLEALVISVFVTLVAALGWPKLNSLLPKPATDFTLAEVEKEPDAKVPIAESEKPLSTDKAASASDSEVAGLRLAQNEAKPVSQEPSASAGDEVSAGRIPPKEAAEAKSETKVKLSESDQKTGEKPVVSGVQIAQASEDNMAAKGESAKVKSMKKKSAKPKLKGFVYRMYMELGDIEAVTETIRNDIQALGGEKAGDVRLGWRKPKGSYFHFRLLEKHYDQIVEKLRAIGPVRIFKDPHWRVMPEGQIRFILWVEDKDLKSKVEREKKEASAASPTSNPETQVDSQEPSTATE